MSDYVAYIDESGCKLKAATTPPDDSDLGVAVALVMPLSLRDSFTTSVREHLPITLTEDLHITDLDADSQRATRDAVFSDVEDGRVAVLYEAITAEGFHHTQHVMLEEAKRQAQACVRGSVKVSASHDNPQAHAELLAGVMSKVRGQVADWEEQANRSASSSHVSFLLDQVDGPILGVARALVAKIDSVGDQHIHRVTWYDTEKKDIVQGAIVSSAQGLNDLQLPQYTVDVRPKTDPGILAADVIANALYRHLRDLIASQGHQVRLNQHEAVSEFALHDHIVGFSDLDTSDVLFGFVNDGNFPSDAETRKGK